VPVKKEELPPYALRLRALRDKLGFDRQIEFAAALGTRQATISRWLNGTARPLPLAFMRMAGLAQGEDRIFFLREGGVLIEDGDPVDPAIAQSFFAGESRPAKARANLAALLEAIPTLDSETICAIMEAASRELAKRARAGRASAPGKELP